MTITDNQDFIRKCGSNVILNKEAAALTNTSFITVTKQLNQNISQLFESDIELDIILYLGLCNGAGWATTLDGRDAVLLGIEKIIELNWQNEDDMQALIFHEIGHIWHKTHGILYPHTHSNGERSLVQLYQEGIAMVCEQILCQDDNRYHQDKNGWLAWCVTNKSEIKCEFLKRIKDNKSTQDFFGDWCKPDAGVYGNIGSCIFLHLFSNSVYKSLLSVLIDRGDNHRA